MNAGDQDRPSAIVAVATQIGRVLGGKYRLEHTLGSGGMGIVMAATHLALGRKVALKFMRLSVGVADDGAATGRFMREARAVAALRSEHVAQVMDVDVDSEDGAPYIVMEYLEGSDLASILESGGVPAVADVVGFVLQACEGVAEAHAHGIVHRDLKPANLFLTRRPDGTPLVKVLDFGVSKLNEAAMTGSFRLTHPREALGSPEYMSPEQIVASPEVDARADIWALGVILYELFTGKPPFTGASFLELGMDVTNRLHPPLSQRVPGLAPGLVMVVDRCLQKAPASRFSNLAALAAALAPHGGADANLSAKRIARTLGIAETNEAAPTVPGGSSGVRGALAGIGSGESEAGSVGGGRVGRAGRIGFIGGALAAIVAGGLLWQRSSHRPSVESPAPAAALPSSPQPSTPSSAPSVAAPIPAAAPSETVAAPPAAAESPHEKSALSHKRRHVASHASTVAAPPPAPGSPSIDGATRTRRGPVVTDL